MKAVSLFDEFESTDVACVFRHMRLLYGFSFARFRKLVPAFSECQRVALINYLRFEKSRRGWENGDVGQVAEVLNSISACSGFWSDPRYLRGDRDDPLLWTEEESEDEDQAESEAGCMNCYALSERLQGAQRLISRMSLSENEDVVQPMISNDDASYVASYSDFEIHREMISDAVRTGAYESFISKNSEILFRDRIVMDVGCGSGVLSMFAARAGAKKVVAVDASPEIAECARRVIKRNNFEKVISVVCGKVEDLDFDLTNLGELTSYKRNSSSSSWERIFQEEGDINKTNCSKERVSTDRLQVDVIISEWMGYALLFESMIHSVFHARDSWLRSSRGYIVPNRVELKVYAADLRSRHIDRWGFEKQFGLDFSDLSPWRDSRFTTSAKVEFVDSSSLLSTAYTLVEIDLMTASSGDVNSLRCPFALEYLYNPQMERTFVSSLVLFFDTFMDEPPGGCASVWFSTGPKAPKTHWKQTVLHLVHLVDQTPLSIAFSASNRIRGYISFSPAVDNPRGLCIAVELKDVVTSVGPVPFFCNTFDVR